MMQLKDILKWAFPNGFGTRAVIAFAVVGHGLTKLDAAQVSAIVGMVVAFYFAKRDDATKGA
jgi:hypothetical protein